MDQVGMFRRIVEWARRSLILKITAPPVLLVLVASLLSSYVLGRLFTLAHEQSAKQRSGHFIEAVEQEFQDALGDGHTHLEPRLQLLCRASETVALVADRERRVRVSCSDELRGTVLPDLTIASERVKHGATTWEREIRPIVTGPSCVGCHAGAARVGYIAVDTPLASAEEEVIEQQRMNLIGGAVIAAVLSVILILVQGLLVYRPIRALAKTVGRIQAGDLDARATIAGTDELAQLAANLNSMAASISAAEAELDRTHRAELVQAEKLAALGQLLSSIAHEIKNPLAGIIGALKVLESDAADTDPNKPILGKILAQMERLSTTVVTSLEFARPMKPTVADVDVVDLIERTIFFVERQADEQHVQLRKRYAAGLPRAHVDPDLMKQVFLNLLLNGIQAMPRGGGLDIEVSAPSESAIEIVISDQGVGIAPEHLDRIFSPFFSTKERGTGLGLYVARQIVETQRGQITVESHLGQGTAFTVRIPTQPAADKE
ncbi:MAG TPA: ATP-binding protein [Polyangiales bacterium]